MSLGNNIREHRKRSGLSQEKLAELVGVSRQAVTKWETGQSAPSTDNLLRLAEIFGISLDVLISTGVEAAVPAPAPVLPVSVEPTRPQTHVRPVQPVAPQSEKQPRKWTVWRKISLWLLLLALLILLIMGGFLIDGLDNDESDAFDMLAKILAPCFYGGFICLFVDSIIRISRKEY